MPTRGPKSLLLIAKYGSPGGPSVPVRVSYGSSGVARVVRNGFNVVAKIQIYGQSRQHLELVVDEKTDLRRAHAVAGVAFTMVT